MEMIALLTSKNRVGYAEERNSPKEKKSISKAYLRIQTFHTLLQTLKNLIDLQILH